MYFATVNYLIYVNNEALALKKFITYMIYVEITLVNFPNYRQCPSLNESVISIPLRHQEKPINLKMAWPKIDHSLETSNIKNRWRTHAVLL